MKKIICRDCNQSVDEISEYVMAAKDEDMEVNEWVRQNDSMYDFFTNTVVCTSCYVDGMVIGKYK